MYSDNSPPDIQTEMDWKGVKVAPRKGTMFGCVKRFHTTASWQNAYMFHQVRAGERSNLGNIHV